MARVFWFTFTIGMMAGLWLLLVGSVARHELAVGAFAVSLTSVFVGVVYRQENRELHFQAADVLQLWRLPAEVLRGIWVLLAVLACDIAGRRSGSWFRYAGIHTAKADPVLAGRRALVSLYGSTAPDTIILGVDYELSRVLLHQLRRSPLAETVRRLGARP